MSTKNIIGHTGDGFLTFYGSNDPINSVKALKDSGPMDQALIPPGPPPHVTIIKHIPR